MANYLGITLGSSMGKLFRQVLKNRLNKVVEQERILKEAQGGFRKDREMVDQNFVANRIGQL